MIEKIIFKTSNYVDESWVGLAIYKVIRGQKLNKCFNRGKFGHLKRNCRQDISRNNTSSGNGRNQKPLYSGVCRRCGKVRHWTNE